MARISNAAKNIARAFIAGAATVRKGFARQTDEAVAILATGFGLPLKDALDAIAGIAADVRAYFDGTAEGKVLAGMTQADQREAARAGTFAPNVADVYNARNAFAMAVSRVRTILRGLDHERQTVGETGDLHKAVSAFIDSGVGSLSGLAKLASDMLPKNPRGKGTSGEKDDASEPANWREFAKAAVRAARKAGKDDVVAALSEILANHK